MSPCFFHALNSVRARVRAIMKEHISATGAASKTPSRPKKYARIIESGMSTMACLERGMSIARVDLPMPWKKAAVVI